MPCSCRAGGRARDARPGHGDGRWHWAVTRREEGDGDRGGVCQERRDGWQARTHDGKQLRSEACSGQRQRWRSSRSTRGRFPWHGDRPRRQHFVPLCSRTHSGLGYSHAMPWSRLLTHARQRFGRSAARPLASQATRRLAYMHPLVAQRARSLSAARRFLYNSRLGSAGRRTASKRQATRKSTSFLSTYATSSTFLSSQSEVISTLVYAFLFDHGKLSRSASHAIELTLHLCRRVSRQILAITYF
jgi:hypothetical protein